MEGNEFCDHEWEPVPLENGQYRCTKCPATGWRSLFTRSSTIHVHPQPRAWPVEPTALPKGKEG